VLAGTGGNGGGGLVAARHLTVAGAKVTVALSAPAQRFAPVPAEQLAIVRRLAIATKEGIEPPGEPELVIDALLGYSQRGEPHGGAAELIRWSAGRRVLALDVPSGLELESGELHAPHVSAEATMTLAAENRTGERRGYRRGREAVACGHLGARTRLRAAWPRILNAVHPPTGRRARRPHPALKRPLYLPLKEDHLKKLKAGTYSIRIRDLSPIHDFHLLGPGMNRKTSVQNTGRATWRVRLERGLYRYRCDPHRTIMHGSFSVS